jgi:crotonobetainyl-CoA:carnitine CoA-transferase CaiB-like acyl-CoA transferase
VPPVMFGARDAVMGPVPGLGEHTEAVLAEFGVDPKQGCSQR